MRISQRDKDKNVQDGREFYDGDKDQDNSTGVKAIKDEKVHMDMH